MLSLKFVICSGTKLFASKFDFFCDELSLDNELLWQVELTRRLTEIAAYPCVLVIGLEPMTPFIIAFFAFLDVPY
jgi:hypothetical protein